LQILDTINLLQLGTPATCSPWRKCFLATMRLTNPYRRGTRRLWSTCHPCLNKVFSIRICHHLSHLKWLTCRACFAARFPLEIGNLSSTGIWDPWSTPMKCCFKPIPLVNGRFLTLISVACACPPRLGLKMPLDLIGLWTPPCPIDLAWLPRSVDFNLRQWNLIW
jgi:hypothetical protein